MKKLPLTLTTRENFICKRVQAQKVDDRNTSCVRLTRGTFRSSIYRQLLRCSNIDLFLAVGLTLFAINVLAANDLVIKKISGPQPSGPFSQALSVDLEKIKNLLFVSGQVPVDPKTGEMNQESIESATETALDSIENLLAEAGTDWNHVVRMDVFLQNFDRDLHGMNEIYMKKFSQDRFPVRQTVGVKLDADTLVEISCIAVVPKKNIVNEITYTKRNK